MIHIDKLDEIGKEFAQLCYEPLLVRAVMKPGAYLCDYEPIHFDSLLAKAVILAVLHSVTLPDSDEAYWLPLPLKALWFDENGLPLWASSIMQPFGNSVRSTHYLHKRNSRLTFSNSAKLETRKGRWMERRQPIPIRVFGDNSGIEARVIGDALLIEELISQWKMIGKHRSRGFGEVLRWEIKPAQFDNVWENDGKLIKPMPVECGLVQCLERPQRIGWTPPQWKPALFRYGWRVGTMVNNTDFFSAIDKL